MEGAASAEAIAPTWRLQLGSLGSGNHFIEVSLDELDRVWPFLRSGSRGVGNRLAVKHIKVARKWCEQAWIQLPDPDRDEMMHRVTGCLGEWLEEQVEAEETICCHHNYTEQMNGGCCAAGSRSRAVMLGISGCHGRARSTPGRGSRA